MSAAQETVAGAGSMQQSTDLDGLAHRKARITAQPTQILLKGVTADNARMGLITLQHGVNLVGQIIDLRTGQPSQLFARPGAGVLNL